MYRFYGHTLHFDKPSWTTYWSLKVYLWRGGEALLEHLFYDGVVSNIAQIYNQVSYMLKGTVGFGKQCLHVLPHALSLLAYIARIHDFTAIVDTGGAGDEYMPAVAIVHIGAALKTYAIFVRRVQVCWSIEVVYLLWL